MPLRIVDVLVAAAEHCGPTAAETRRVRRERALRGWATRRLRERADVERNG